LAQLPTRPAHPCLFFSRREVCPLLDRTLPPHRAQTEAIIVENLPFDKYELDSCPLTHYILTIRRPNACWLVHVLNSARVPGPGRPFGYLKANSDFTAVNLIVLPYDFMTLNMFLQSLFKVWRFIDMRTASRCRSTRAYRRSSG
jgi:hypothetical protein